MGPLRVELNFEFFHRFAQTCRILVAWFERRDDLLGGWVRKFSFLVNGLYKHWPVGQQVQSIGQWVDLHTHQVQPRWPRIPIYFPWDQNCSYWQPRMSVHKYSGLNKFFRWRNYLAVFCHRFFLRLSLGKNGRVHPVGGAGRGGAARGCCKLGQSEGRIIPQQSLSNSLPKLGEKFSGSGFQCICVWARLASGDAIGFAEPPVKVDPIHRRKSAQKAKSHRSSTGLQNLWKKARLMRGMWVNLVGESPLIFSESLIYKRQAFLHPNFQHQCAPPFESQIKHQKKSKKSLFCKTHPRSPPFPSYFES